MPKSKPVSKRDMERSIERLKPDMFCPMTYTDTGVMGCRYDDSLLFPTPCGRCGKEIRRAILALIRNAKRTARGKR